MDIGNYVSDGDATYNATTKTYKVSGSGDDIWNAADAFHYVYKKMTGAYEIEGDYVITAIAEATWTKAGLMVREGLGTSDANAFGLVRSNNDFAMAGRSAFGGASSDSTYVVPADPNIANKYKVVKLGSSVTGYMWDASTKKWVLHSSKTIPTAAETFVGLAVTSHDVNQVAEAEFTNVKITEYPFEVSRIPEIASYSVGQTFAVSLVVDVRDGQKVDSLVIKEAVPPKAAAITNISDGGKLDKGIITWTLTNVTADKTVTYSVTAPDDLNIATLSWGTGTVNGAGIDIPLGDTTLEMVTFNVAETFSYPSNDSNELAGKTMDARNGGFGWNAAWKALLTTEKIVLDTATLDAGVVQSQPVKNHDTGAETNPGNYSVKLSGDVSTGLSRKLPVVADGGEVWFSFTFKEEGPAANHWSGMTLYNAKGDEVCFVGKPYQAAFVGIGGTTGGDALSKVAYTQANHILLRAVIKGANSKVYLWINPDKTDRLDTADASGGDSIDNIAELRLRRGGATGSAYYDNLWISSVPALPPAGAGRVDLQIDNPNRDASLPAWDVISIDQIDDGITGQAGYGHDSGNNYYLLVTGCIYYSNADLTLQTVGYGLPVDHMSGLNGHILGPYNNAAFENFKNSIKFMNNPEQTGPFTFNMVPQGKYKQLRSAQTVGDGDGQLLCTLNYADGTTQDTFLHADDWFNDGSEIQFANTRQLINGMDRLEGGASTFNATRDPAVFECYIDANPDKVLKSVTLTLDTTSTSPDPDVGYNLYDIWAVPATSQEPGVAEWSLF